jgi:hypothetical protein
MENRKDPVEIIARLGGVLRATPDVRRALEVWFHLAQKAGWDVEIDSQVVDDASEERGRVKIEGLTYVIRYSRRVRRALVDDSTGSPVVRPVFAYAAWAEPVIDEELE